MPQPFGPKFESDRDPDEKINLTFREMLRNARLMLGYFVRFVPGYFWINVVYILFVSFVWVVTGSLFLKYVFDALEQEKEFSEICWFLLLCAGLMILRNLLGSYVVEYLQPRAFITVSEKMRTEMFEKAVKMDLAYYETPQFYTDFVWAASQAERRCMQMHGAWASLLARVSELLFLGGVMVALDPVILVFAAVSAVIRMLVNKKLISLKYHFELQAKPFERERDYSQRIFYLSDYAKEIRLSNIHLLLYDRFRRASARMYEIFKKGGRRLSAIAAGGAVVQDVFLTLLLLLYLSYKIVVIRDLSLGDFAALVSSAGRFSWRLTQMVDVFTNFIESSLYVEKFRNFLDYKPNIEGHPGGEPSNQAEEIRLTDVSFTYHGETHPSLEHINLTIKPGEKIAIVGYNGAGKSTLVKLLMRLYDVSEGTLTVGGRDVKSFATDAYRKQFGAIFQDYQIFAATLGENVTMDFVKDDDREKIIAALNHTGMGEKLKTMDRGIDTPLTREYEEDGRNLSGGEGQKTAVARVFLRHFRYIIMDEPSSALDPISEYQLNRNMMELARDKTVIFISHRLSTTCMADRIYMLEKGRIIEQGSHDELMRQNGKYAEMFRLQAEKYQAS